MPLGKMSEESVMQGYRYLREIEKALNKFDEAKNSKKSDYAILDDLSSKFYSYIPHDFGYSNIRDAQFRIDSLKKV